MGARAPGTCRAGLRRARSLRHLRCRTESNRRRARLVLAELDLFAEPHEAGGADLGGRTDWTFCARSARGAWLFIQSTVTEFRAMANRLLHEADSRSDGRETPRGPRQGKCQRCTRSACSMPGGVRPAYYRGTGSGPASDPIRVELSSGLQ